MPIPAPRNSRDALVVDPAAMFDLSPYLYMQFMEPLGSTDGSVEASWNHRENRWRKDLVKVTKGVPSNAASIAAMVLSTEALVTGIPEPKRTSPAPEMPEY